MARLARRRRARFVETPTGVEPADADSAALVAIAATEVAAWLGYASVAAYDAATPKEREFRISRTTAVERTADWFAPEARRALGEW